MESVLKRGWTASAGTANRAHAAIISDAGQWNGLASQWNRLVQSSPTGAAALSHEWLSAWWRTYGAAYSAGPQALQVVTVFEDEQLIGALPLYRSVRKGLLGVRQLRLLSTGEAESEETCASYLNLLYTPDTAGAVLDAVSRVLADGDDWDELDLPYVPEGSPLVTMARQWPGPGHVEIRPMGECRISNLGGGFAEYLRRLSSATRAEVNRSLRSVERCGASFRVARSVADADCFFDGLIELHQRGWQERGKPGCFASRRFTEFHRGLARELVPAGRAILSALSVENQPLGYVYSVIHGDKCDSYLQGVVREHEIVRSPGTAVHALTQRYAAEQGLLRYDYLLARQHSYKHRFTSVAIPLVHIVIRRRNARTAVCSVASMLSRGLRRSGRLMLLRGRKATTT